MILLKVRQKIKWTKEKPKKSGYYWYSKYYSRVVEVIFPEKGTPFYLETGYSNQYYLCNAHEEWAGPIPMPEEE